jgi:hypothetical protein
MSGGNVELALRAYEAFNRRDWDAFVALMDVEVEVVTRIAAVEVAGGAGTGWAAGGRPCSRRFRTTTSRLSSCATWGR